MSPSRKEQQDIRQSLWTQTQAALHVGVTRATIERYVREGLPVYFGQFVKPSEFMAEYLKRRASSTATRAKRSST